MPDILQKLNSDRLWALLAWIALVVVNSVFDLGLEHAVDGGDSVLIMTMWATITFIVGKSLRSTTGGTIFDGIARVALARIQGIQIGEPLLGEVSPPDAPPEDERAQ